MTTVLGIDEIQQMHYRRVSQAGFLPRVQRALSRAVSTSLRDSTDYNSKLEQFYAEGTVRESNSIQVASSADQFAFNTYSKQCLEKSFCSLC